jgi:lipoate-protein ligase A
MISKSIYKIPNGKLLKIKLDFNENSNKINEIKITGDFFVYPEEAIEILEDGLKDIKIDKIFLLKKINSLVKDYKIDFIGLHAEGLTEGILMCIK